MQHAASCDSAATPDMNMDVTHFHLTSQLVGVTGSVGLTTGGLGSGMLASSRCIECTWRRLHQNIKALNEQRRVFLPAGKCHVFPAVSQPPTQLLIASRSPGVHLAGMTVNLSAGAC